MKGGRESHSPLPPPHHKGNCPPGEGKEGEGCKPTTKATKENDEKQSPSLLEEY